MKDGTDGTDRTDACSPSHWKELMEFGRGFGEKNLWRMIQFAEVFPDETIVASLRRQLGWTHFKAIIPIADPLKRDFYAEMCRIQSPTTTRQAL